MESDKASKMLGDLRQLLDRWELELGAKPVWWRRYTAIRTDDDPRKPERSSANSRAGKSREPATRLTKPAHRGGTRKLAGDAASEAREG